MLFNSGQFLFVFLPITLILFYAAGLFSQRAAKMVLAAASLVFYSVWDIRNVPIILLSISVCYLVGRKIQSAPAANWVERRRWMIVGVTFNLLLLGLFKYGNFFADNAFSLVGAPPPAIRLWLPIGISFYTFTQIAYLVDAAVGKAKEQNLTNYALFVSYFPHQIAGPILHHSEMMPQFDDPAVFRPSLERFVVGLSLASIGLFKKVVIADSLSASASTVFDYADAGHAVPFFGAWAGALAYTAQIYYDFSGYTDMALGISVLMGIKLPVNFNSPYRSTSIIDFWRRWHMTLSRFLRDYLYFPLGGNRKGPTRRYVNLLVTMVLGGLWHGAGWTYLAWGGLHGIYLVVNHGWRHFISGSRWAGLWPSRLRTWLAWSATFVAVVAAWVFFRASTFSGAFIVLKGMAGLNGTAWPPYFASLNAGLFPAVVHGEKFLGPLTSILGPLLAIVALVATVTLPNSQMILRGTGATLNGDDNCDQGEFSPKNIPWAAWICFFGAIGGMSLAIMGGLSEFLYFNF